MQINISGKNMDTGMAFQEHAVTSLNAVVEKYFQNAVSGQVTLEKADSGFTVKTRVALARRMELEATGRAADAHAALDAAIEHAEKRLRRHKRRLKNHRTTLTSSEENDVDAAPMLIYASPDQYAAEEGEERDGRPAAQWHHRTHSGAADRGCMRIEAPVDECPSNGHDAYAGEERESLQAHGWGRVKSPEHRRANQRDAQGRCREGGVSPAHSQ